LVWKGAPGNVFSTEKVCMHGMKLRLGEGARGVQASHKKVCIKMMIITIMKK